ncbi:hypothetical protein FB645_001787 [Coemansia sp. IMI 203386]|nr:hypothetical protein FB645_001787 [Coemansia sp. IMI 203386]
MVMQNSAFDDRASEYSLLHVCQRWRMLFVKEALADLSISLCDNFEADIKHYKWPRTIGSPCFVAEEIVTTMHLNYSRWQFMKAHMSRENLCKAAFGDRKYVSVQTINSCICLDDSFDTNETVRQLEYLLLQLKYVMPNCEKISIQTYLSEVSNIEYSPRMLFSKVLSGLSNKVHNISTAQSSSLEVFVPASFAHFTELTELKFSANKDKSWFSAVVQRNSRTLNRLYVSDIDKLCIGEMVYNVNGTPVVYPNMQVLNLRFNSEYLEYSDNQFNHFPVLKRLGLMSYYPVCSSVFLSSSGTLKCLEMSVLPRLVQFAQQHPVLCFKQLSGLEYMNISFEGRQENGRMYIVKDNDVVFVKNILQTMSKISRLKISTIIEYQMFSPLVTSQILEHVQVLDINRVRFDFADVVYLLQQAPHLGDLRLTIRNTVPLIGGTDKQEIACPLSKHLRLLSVSSNYLANNVENYVLAIALLIAGCPMLTMVWLVNIDSFAVGEGLLAKAKTNQFAEYSEHINDIAMQMLTPQ